MKHTRSGIFGTISHIRKVRRTELFPHESPNPKSDREYYQVFLRSLDPLPNPIPSLRLRRIVFIATTMRKLQTATEINDLFDDSPLEDTHLEHLKRLKLPAERQWEELIGSYRFFLDFAMFCRSARSTSKRRRQVARRHRANTRRQQAQQRPRNQRLARLRFSGLQIRESIPNYCVPKISETIDRLGGLETLGRKIIIHSEDCTIIQTSMFEDE